MLRRVPQISERVQVVAGTVGWQGHRKGRWLCEDWGGWKVGAH